MYGEPNAGRSRTPYEGFRRPDVRGAGFSEARVRERLLGQPGAGMAFVRNWST
jgi:hypothetical protein